MSKDLDDKLLEEINAKVESSGLGYGEEEPIGEVSNDIAAEFVKDQKLEKEFGDSPVKAAALGAARGVSFGLSDQLLTKTGIMSAEELRETKARNEISSLLGEVAGVAGPAIASGGTSLAASGAKALGSGVSAVTKAGLVAEKAFASALASTGKKSIAREIARKAASKGLGSAVEGAAFSTGQLISEDALGTSELNAENLLAATSQGAILGAGAGAFFGTAQALIPAAKSAKGAVSGKMEKLKNPTDASFDIYGVTPKQRIKLTKTAPQFVEELPEWTVEKAKLGKFTNSKKLNANIVAIKEEAGDAISETLKKIDKVSESNQHILPTNAKVYAGLARKVQDDIIAKYTGVPGMSATLKPVFAIRDDLIGLAKVKGSLKATQLHSLRQKIDKQIKFEKIPGQRTLKEEALMDLRFAINDEISQIAKAASANDVNKSFGSLLDDLKSANKDYSYASRLEGFIESKVSKDDAKRSIFNLSDFILGDAAFEVLGSGGGAVLAGKKLIESDFRRRLAILSYVEKQNKKITSTIDGSVKTFIKSSKLPKKTLAVKALVDSNLSLNEKEKKPKNKREAFKNISKNISDLVTDPEKLQQRIARRTIQLTNVAPNTAMNVNMSATRALEFLNSKMPKQASTGSIIDAIKKKEFQPSEAQLSKFERYLEVVENPMTALKDLESGQLSREGAEALQVVYPTIFAQVQEKVMAELQSSETQVPYSRRLQLGILLNIPSDSSLEPKNIASLQASVSGAAAQQEQAQQSSKATPARADSLNMAERQETKANRIAQR